MASSHVWKFFRIGGLDQVALESGADLLALKDLDQKLWVALSCPVNGLELDAKTLALIDADKDGRIRVPELLAAIDWAALHLEDLGVLLLRKDSLPLSAFKTSTPEGKSALVSAKRILANFGQPDASEITLAQAADIARITPCLRLDLLPLTAVAEHVFTPGRLLSAASIDDAIGRPLREALSDALLPGVRHLRLSSLQDDPPAELACVISMEVMVDPVIAADGKSYERASIEAYWKQQGGTPISPVTREVLPTSNLVPNINLRSICHEYRQRHARSKAAATSTEQLTLSALHAAHLRTKALQMAPLITRAVHQACEAAAAGGRVTAGAIGKRARAQPTTSISDFESKLGKRVCAGCNDDGEHGEEHGEGDDRGAEGASLEAEGRAVEGAAKENGGQGGKKAMRTAARPQGALMAAAAADVTADAYDPKGCVVA